MLYPDEINPLKNLVPAHELDEVDISTLYIWRNQLINEIGNFAIQQDYSNPELEGFVYNLMQVYTAIVNQDKSPDSMGQEPGPPVPPESKPF